MNMKAIFVVMNTTSAVLIDRVGRATQNNILIEDKTCGKSVVT